MDKDLSNEDHAFKIKIFLLLEHQKELGELYQKN